MSFRRRQVRFVAPPPVVFTTIQDAIDWLPSMEILNVFESEKMKTGFVTTPFKLKPEIWLEICSEAGLSTHARAQATPFDKKRRNIGISVTECREMKRFVQQHRKRVIELMVQNRYRLRPGNVEKKQPSLFNQTCALMESLCRQMGREAKMDAADDASTDTLECAYMKAWNDEFNQLDKKWQLVAENQRLLTTGGITVDRIADLRARGVEDSKKTSYPDDEEDENEFDGPPDARYFQEKFKPGTVCRSYTHVNKKTGVETERWSISLQVHPHDTKIMIYDGEPPEDAEGNLRLVNPALDKNSVRWGTFERFREYGVLPDGKDHGPPQNDLEGKQVYGRPIQVCITGGWGYDSSATAGQRLLLTSGILASKPDYGGASKPQTEEAAASDMGFDATEIGQAVESDINALQESSVAGLVDDGSTLDTLQDGYEGAVSDEDTSRRSDVDLSEPAAVTSDKPGDGSGTLPSDLHTKTRRRHKGSSKGSKTKHSRSGNGGGGGGRSKKSRNDAAATAS